MFRILVVILFLFCSCSKEDADIKGCDGSLKIEVIESLDAIPNGNIGKLVVRGTGGTLPYTFSINGGAFGISASFKNLNPQNHTISIKDNSGCTAEVTTVVQEQLFVSYTANVAPILTESCMVPTCHCSGNPYCFENWDLVSAAQIGIHDRVSAGAMPPPTSGITLNPSDRESIINWIYQGAKNN
jgi:hypothetical protein